MVSSGMTMGRTSRVGTMQDQRQQMVDALNEDLAFELSAIAQYVTYAARATGPYRRALAKSFRHEIPEETGHATFLADKIVAMGGEPATEAAPVPLAHSNLEMVQAALRSEEETIERYTRHLAMAEEMGDVGLRVALEDIIREETEHRDELLRMLRDWGSEEQEHTRARGREGGVGRGGDSTMEAQHEDRRARGGEGRRRGNGGSR